LFSQAVGNWDERKRLLLVAMVQTFLSGTRVWVVVDDTLCHKRGAKVALGASSWTPFSVPIGTKRSASAPTGFCAGLGGLLAVSRRPLLLFAVAVARV